MKLTAFILAILLFGSAHATHPETSPLTEAEYQEAVKEQRQAEQVKEYLRRVPTWGLPSWELITNKARK